MRDYYPEVSKYFSPATGFDTPLTAVEGRGAQMLCHDGKTYLDFASGVAVTNAGHSPKRVVAALHKQLDAFLHSGDIFVNEPYLKLAKKLRAIVPIRNPKFFFSCSGAEAVEGCMKLARRVSGRQGIVCFRGAFHGRTLGATSVTTSSSHYRIGYGPFLGSIYRATFPNCYRCPLGKKPDSCAQECIDNIEQMFHTEIAPQEVAAILIEPMQGEGGYLPAPKKFLQALRRLCDRYGIFLIFDEVQCGMGRTGHWFAGEYYGVEPDIMAIGKGIASGLPLSAVCAKDSIMSRWEPGAHGTTFGGNVLCCTAAVATIETIEKDNVLPQVRSTGRMILERLEKMKRKYAIIGDVRGVGYFVGIEIVKDKKSKKPNPKARERIQKYCFKKGLILIYCGTYGNVIRFLPPLVTPREQIVGALDIFEQAVAKVNG